MNFELKTKTITLNRNGEKVSFTLRELNADTYWDIEEKCVDHTKPNAPLDTHQLNLLCLAKAIIDPPMNLEAVANLPKQISDRLLGEFLRMNNAGETYFLEEKTQQNTEKSESSSTVSPS